MCQNATAMIDNTQNNESQKILELTKWIKAEALALGFSACGIAEPNTRNQIAVLQEYLAKGYEGEMAFLHENHDKRADPKLLVANTQSIISVRLDYITSSPAKRQVTDNAVPNNAIIARYARGRDYHKTMRGMLKRLAQRIEKHLEEIGLEQDFTWRPFADSAPIFEKVLAENAGLGWTGKNTLLINRKAGSFFVIGELFTSLPLPFDGPDIRKVPKRKRISEETIPIKQLVTDDSESQTKPIQSKSDVVQLSNPQQPSSLAPTDHCGRCTACIDVCPTQAIVKPYMLDARLCIAYQTIENKGKIPVELRKPIGNRVFGCDDCQLICPWNGFAKVTTLADFQPRHSFDSIELLDVWQWQEAEFLKKTEGSPLRRTGYHAIMRNIAIGLGNAPYSEKIVYELNQRKDDFDDNVAEHIQWSIGQQLEKQYA